MVAMERLGLPHVLRVCSVFEAPTPSLRRPGFDQIGGMQVHTSALTRRLDATGFRQTVVTARRPEAPRVASIPSDVAFRDPA
jgi:hypothetical protein